MKKKKLFYRILSVMFCFMIVLFVGCDANSEQDFNPDDGEVGDVVENEVDVLDGTKVLSRPSGYSFSDAVGVYSEFYYNLYARSILEKLYKIKVAVLQPFFV